ncbi:12797_t:CDS:2 [Ambispora leptoticha]|uniref:12797_t:CDS:1 n=1 Tax=Ambispora leptoticha TaxID=144679 RepID=A0A9N9C632_9GLOM|nr:12797_t:CDS:2 [Ambispora leptoticha]
MKYIFAAFVVLLAIAYVPYSEAACAAQANLDSCVSTEKAAVSTCSAADYGCLCEKYQALLTCYAQCPSDPTSQSTANGVQGSLDSYCNAASATSSHTSTTTTSSSTGTTSATSAAATTTKASSTGSSESATPSSTKNVATNLDSNHLWGAFCFVTTFISLLLF